MMPLSSTLSCHFQCCLPLVSLLWVACSSSGDTVVQTHHERFDSTAWLCQNQHAGCSLVMLACAAFCSATGTVSSSGCLSYLVSFFCMLSNVHYGREGVCMWCMAYTCKCTLIMIRPCIIAIAQAPPCSVHRPCMSAIHTCHGMLCYRHLCMHTYTNAISRACTHVCTGNGANMAFVDAWQLALQLTSPEHLTLEEAIAAYDAESAPRCTAAVQGGSANIARWHRQGFAYHITLVVYFLLGRLLQGLAYFGMFGPKQTSKGSA